MFKLNKFKIYIKSRAEKERQEATFDILKRIKLPENAKYLDVGCNIGKITATNSEQMGISLKNTYGMDNVDELVQQARELFNTKKVDLEHESFPYPNNSFDVIIVSEVFEHLKNINFVLDEIYRVLKTDGYLLVSTPNLAAFHNRILLLFGRQPRCISLFVGTHVRGFTLPAWKKLLCLNKFQILKVSGVGFYPFWGITSKIIVKIFPSLAVRLIILSKKTR